ncbi:MAG: DNA-processing protein DprA [Paludibacteraceae bacterium]|nr:DNA-processing protein DprA [Paludibacteraceae bacterium]
MTGKNAVRQIALNSITGLSNVKIERLLNVVETEENIFKLSNIDLKKILFVTDDEAQSIVSQFRTSLESAEDELEYVLKNNISVLYFKDDDYPSSLLECNDFPILLYVKGNIDFNSKKFISIVGTRRATERGKRLCTKFVSDLAETENNIVFVSGLAFGIDVTAHKSALNNNIPTVGVIAGGLNKFYPKEHKYIADKMIENGGAVVTESNRDVEPLAPYFVQRNRIIAGLSLATIVVESAIKGGSLLTAKYANSYNRDVFAFPGGVGERLSEGCNNIIKYNKAGMIENADDFRYFMGWVINGMGKNIAMEYLDLSEEERKIYGIIEHNKTIHIDTLTLTLGNIKNLQETLLKMELKGIIESHPGNFYSLL